MKHILSLLLFLSCSITAGPVITFFFNEYPLTKERAEEISRKLSNPYGLAKRSLEGLTMHYPIAGIFSTYFGFLQVSNAIGQTTFPRKQSNPTINIFVTNRMTPIMMMANTINHWELEQGTPVDSYTVTLNTDDQTQLLYYKVEKNPAPTDNKLPLNSIIIVAKPNNVYLPEGITIAKQDANLILPTIYVKKGININRNALYMLNLAPFFRPVDMLFKKEPKAVESLVEEY